METRDRLAEMERETRRDVRRWTIVYIKATAVFAVSSVLVIVSLLLLVLRVLG